MAIAAATFKNATPDQKLRLTQLQAKVKAAKDDFAARMKRIEGQMEELVDEIKTNWRP